MRVLPWWSALGLPQEIQVLSMEDRSVNGVESEEIYESFLCCICLELLYKPVVLFCGHISCFWCVHKSMNSLLESHCPICRHPYNHFPSISESLHFLLMKMYPIAYKNREDHILEEERNLNRFSPQFDSHTRGSHAYGEFNYRGDSKNYSTTEIKGSFVHVQLEPSPPIEAIKSVVVEENNLPQDKINGKYEHFSIADLLCATCKQLLFRPVVLNCGHVYCEGCVINPADKMLRCQVCQSMDPRGFPKVCLVLDHFLEENFPKEYALRRDAVQLKQDLSKYQSTTSCSTKAGKQGFSFSSGDQLPCRADPRSMVHIYIGCDSCGMYPIIGDRYRCKNCVEAIGFDLCGDCYNTRSKLPGRFNQQHTPEHRFELVKIRNIILRLVTGRSEDGSTTLVISNDDPENGSHVSTLSSGSQENTSSDLTAPVTQTDIFEDPNGTRSTN